MNDIIVVDDEKDIRTLLSGILEDEGYHVRTAADSDAFFSLLSGRMPSIVLLDIWLKKSPMDGMEMLYKIRQNYPDLPVIMISGHGTIDTAVRAMQAGAFSFLEKPIKIDYLFLLIERALKQKKLEKLQEKHAPSSDIPIELQGNSAAITHLRTLCDKYAPQNSRLLITGQKGSGKKTLARYLHHLSSRSDKMFYSVSCRTPENELEILLFGKQQQENPTLPQATGLLEQAHLSTLFLEDLEYLPHPLQKKLTRFMADKSFTRLQGSDSRITSDIRLMASLNIHPQKALEDQILLKDFYERLNVVQFYMPNLRERQEDISVLIENFLKKIATEQKMAPPVMQEDALLSLQLYDWQGNLKQLVHILEYLVMMAKDGSIKANDLPHDIRTPYLPHAMLNLSDYMTLPIREAREMFEREYLKAQLAFFKGNISKTAHFIEMERSALHRKIRGLGLVSKEIAEQEEIIF